MTEHNAIDLLKRLHSWAHCPECERSAWHVSRELNLDALYVELGTRIVPVVAVVCKQCGFMKLFKADLVGY